MFPNHTFKFFKSPSSLFSHMSKERKEIRVGEKKRGGPFLCLNHEEYLYVSIVEIVYKSTNIKYYIVNIT